MNKAEEIFRTYFSTPDDLNAFMKTHEVISYVDESWGADASELHVYNENDERMVYDDKPSRIYVSRDETWYATIAWEIPDHKYHREIGPAVVCVNHMGGTLNCHYKDGVMVNEGQLTARKKKSGKYFFRRVLIE